MGELIFLPAVGLSDVEENTNSLEIMEKLGFTNNFLYKDKSPFFYPYFLMSAYYGRQSPNIRDANKLKDVYIFGDSGGFQNITMDANLDPKDVLAWQQKNCDAGVILDVPPFQKIEGSAQFGKTTDAVYENALNKTIINASIALENWTEPNFKLYGVVQGDNFKRQKRWLKEMLKLEVKYGKKFGGWGLSPKPSHDIQQIAHHAVNILEEGIDKPLHILQVSGFKSLAMAAYVSTFFDSEVTVDSSTFTVGRIYWTYFNPYDFLDKWDFGGRNNTKFANLGCDCPICSRISIDHLQYEGWKNRSPPGMLIALHDLYQIIKYVKFLNMIKTNETAFRKFALKHFGQKFINAMNYVKDSGVGHSRSFATNVKRSHNLLSFAGVKVEEQGMDFKEWAREHYGDIDDELAKKLFEHEFGSED